MGMWKVHQFSTPPPVITVNGPAAPEQSTPKQLTYELFGSLGDGGCSSTWTSTAIRIGLI
ncbi:putative membrane protein [Mycobacterium xenopi 3993]|nr:putative membrane protein [Mycobacterium xenopi 3993]